MKALCPVTQGPHGASAGRTRRQRPGRSDQDAPAAASAALASPTVASRSGRWTPASTASAPPMTAPSTRCVEAARRPRWPRPGSRPRRPRPGQLQVEALPGAVAVHGVEDDLARAPAARTRTAHATASMPGGRPAAVGVDLASRRPPARRRTSIPTTTHWAPKVSDISAISSGRATAAELTLTLSAPTRSRRRASSRVRTPPPTVKGMKTCSARAGDHVEHGGAAVGRRGDVVEHQLVGALRVVAGGQLHGVAGVAQVQEVDALDHPAGVDVEAGDDPDGPHGAPGASARRPAPGRDPVRRRPRWRPRPRPR